MSLTTEAVNRPRATIATLLLLCGCFLLSGIAALVYQTAWTRQFAIVFGTSELAVATVLAAYMGGLAAGAWLAQRFLPRVTRPVITYAFLELGIALGALFVVPAMLWLANLGLVALFGGEPSPPDAAHAGTTLFYLVVAFAALALPTTLMGATLPMLARYAVSDDAQIGRRISLLYATNTAGAVLGALLTAFVLLPALGLTQTLWAGAALNGVVFLLAAALGQRVSGKAAPRGYSLDEPVESSPLPARHATFNRFPGAGWVLPLMLLAGAVAFFHEVLWTRMLAHVVGSSVHAFGVMVASFLAGIALGGALGSAFGKTRQRATAALGTALLVAAAAAALAYLQLERLLPDSGGLFHDTRNLLFAGLLLLPMTLAIGMTYPLAVRVLARDADDAAPASARVYAWNTLGAILGSLAAGFVLIPLLRYEGAIRVAVYASALLGIAALWMLLPVNRLYAGIASALALVGCALFMPQVPTRLLAISPLNLTAGRILYYDVGRTASVVVMAQDGGLVLRTNGLPESMMDSAGSVPRFSGENWLSPLAVIARPDTTDMLVVGFGGGVVLEAVPPSVKHVDVIELEPQVIAANRAIAPRRRQDPLSDPRVHLIYNDARGALRLTEHRYQAIVSQPSHPWTAGASHLYTREFMQLAHQHLAPGGVFVQWMNVMFMDEELLRSLTATLLDVFGEVRVYRPDPGTLVFLASDQPLAPEARVATNGQPLRDAPLHYSRFGINNAEDLVSALVLDAEGARRLASGAALITDDDNRLATSSVYERGRGLTNEAAGRILTPYDPLQRPDSALYAGLRGQLSFPYIVRRNSVFVGMDASLADRAGHMSQILGDTPEGHYALAYYYRMKGQGQRSQEVLRLAIDQFPAEPVLRKEFLRARLNELVGATGASEDVRELAASLPGPAAEVLAAMRHAARNEWREVVQAEPRLAEIAWSDAWYPETLPLRANWRTLVSDPEKSRRFANESIQLLDRTAIMDPTPVIYEIRARAGFAAQRPGVVVESVSNYVRLASAMARAGAFDARALRAGRATLRGMLDEAARLKGADAARIEEVRAEIDRLIPAS